MFFSAWGLSYYLLIITRAILGLHGPSGAAITGVLSEAAGPVAIFLWLKTAGRPRPVWVGRASRWAGDIGLGIVAGVVIHYAADVLFRTSIDIGKAISGRYPVVPNISAPYHGGWLIALGFLLIVVAPICEEVVFRGFLFRGLRTRWPWWSSALLASFLFAIVHASPYRLADTFVGGLILAGIYERRKSLLASIAAHSTINTIVFVGIVRYLR